jgi:type II secretion system protein C
MAQQAEPAVRTTAAPAPALKPTPAAAPAIISARDLFAARAREPEEDQAAPAPALEAPWGLKLRGLALGSLGIASIEDLASHHIGLYLAGDSLGNGATLTEVQPDRVIISRHGMQWELPLEDGPPGAPTKTAVRHLPALSADFSPFVRHTGENKYHVRREVIERVVADLSAIRGERRMPVRETDLNIPGIRFYRPQPNSPWAVLGIRDGDMITAINGVKPGSYEGFFTQLLALQQTDRFSLTLERNGAEQVLSYFIE